MASETTRSGFPMVRGGESLGTLGSTSPFQFMRRMMEDMDRLFEQFGVGGGMTLLDRPRELLRWVPRIELSDSDGEHVIRAELPGLKPEEIKVTALENAVIIEGERKSSHEERNEEVYRSESQYGAFRRVIPLPEGAEIESTSARFENGVLELRVKKGKHAEPRPIEIATAGGQEQPQVQKQQAERRTEEEEGEKPSVH